MTTRIVPLCALPRLAIAFLVSATFCATEGAPEQPRATANVLVTPAAQRAFERRVSVSGNVLAKHTAIVSARSEGIIEAVFVDEGDDVKAGETKLFQVDREVLSQAAGAAAKATAVAECAVREKEAALEQVRADYEKARIDYDRYKRLFEDDRAVTKNAFEVQESRYLQLAAALKHATVLVELSRRQHEQAIHSQAIADRNLADALVTAPIDGVVSQRFMEPGERAKPGSPIVRIEDLSVVEISASLPDEFYGAVHPGATPVRAAVGSSTLNSLTVSYKSPTVTPDLRTFQVKCLLKDPPAGVVPGRIARVDAILEARNGVGVPSHAVIRRAGKAVVFVEEKGTARMVAIETGLVTDGWVEVTSESIKPGERIITLGQESLNNGNPVKVVEEGR